MQYFITHETLYAAACLVFIFSGIFCGITRYLHLCKPYNENSEYFYPAYKQCTFFFSAIILQFPYLLNPMDVDTWTYIRMFGIVYYPICFSLLFKRYFRREPIKHNNGKFGLFSISFTIIVASLMLVIFHEGNILFDAGYWLMIAIGLISILLTSGYLQEAHRIKLSIKSINEQEYSNEEDFSFVFAKKVYYMPLIWIGFMWLIFITGSHWLKFVIDIVCAFWMIFFLIYILSPQQLYITSALKKKKELMKEQICDIAEEIKSINPQLSNQNLDMTHSENEDSFQFSDEVRNEVLQVVLNKFKNPHLQKSEVLNEISFGNKMEANRFIIHYKYYVLVNTFRLEYARKYTLSHPRATIDEVATAAGFCSRYAFNNAKKKVPQIDSSLINDIDIKC